MEDDKEPSVKITMNVLHKDIQEIKELVVRLVEREEATKNHIEDHESRLRKLERYAAKAAGIVATVGAFSGLLVGLIIKFIGN